jgi:hypothetical protein
MGAINPDWLATRSLKPLGHLASLSFAGGGVEPSQAAYEAHRNTYSSHLVCLRRARDSNPGSFLHPTVFKTAAINHSASPPIFQVLPISCCHTHQCIRNELLPLYYHFDFQTYSSFSSLNKQVCLHIPSALPK